ncbi:MAG TPA: cellulase family glycosylhydrolase, partial [Ktedonobacterales bacterium]|nr:cellulase family glycosylhydrolase [Ktedonobacterales bacterium]
MRVRSRRSFMSSVVVIVLAGVVALGINLHLPGVGGVDAASAAPNLHVSGTSIVDSANKPVFLHGVNYSGGEYACIQGWGIFDGPSNQTFVNGLLSANINAIRLPMNEDCWLGINGVTAAYSGANYRNAFVSFVNLLTANGITPELDLQWNAPGTQRATGTKSMPDADHSGAFWQSMATTFAGRTDVIFDLYNEPHPSSWNIWLNGGMDGGFNAIGMKDLVSIVRNAGFHGVLSLSGIDYANTLGGTSGWLAHKPADPDKNLVAAVHVYKGNAHQTTSAWNSDFGPTAAQVPLLNNELGAYCYDDSCVDPNLATQFWTWLASVGGDGTMAWTWDTWGTVEALVSSYNGPTLTSWGQQVKNQYAKYASSVPSASTAAPTTPATATGVPSTPIPAAPTATSNSSRGLSLVQSASRFIDYAGVNKSYAKFPNTVHTGHLLVALVSIAGGNPYTVAQVKDDLGNTWTKAVSGVNGDNTDVEIWYTNSAASGADQVYATLEVSSGASSKFAQSYMTIAEFSGAAALHDGHETGSGLMGI